MSREMSTCSQTPRLELRQNLELSQDMDFKIDLQSKIRAPNKDKVVKKTRIRKLTMRQYERHTKTKNIKDIKNTVSDILVQALTSTGQGQDPCVTRKGQCQGARQTAAGTAGIPIGAKAALQDGAIKLGQTPRLELRQNLELSQDMDFKIHLQAKIRAPNKDKVRHLEFSYGLEMLNKDTRRILAQGRPVCYK